MKTISRRKQLAPLIAGAIVFLLAAIGAYQGGDKLFLLIYSAIFAINVAAIKFVERLPVETNLIVSLANGLLCFYQAYYLFQIGKKGLPYAYLIAGIGFMIAAYVALRKRSAQPTTD
jgi:hypothetical protein